MAKWHGYIGYVEKGVEIEPGIYKDKMVEREYSGDSYKNNSLIQNSGNVSDDVNITNQISIVADPYATYHMYDMRYVTFQGRKWKVTNIGEQYPRLVLTLGGLYTNGE